MSDRLIISLFFFVLLCSSRVQGEVSSLIQETELYLEAGDYQKALSLQEELFDTLSDRWKKTIVEYNIATIFLIEGKNSEAIKHYSTIDLGKKPFPPLLYNSKKNLAIARLQMARRLVDMMKEKGAYIEEDYLKALFLVRQAIDDVKEAQSANCKILEIEGENICTPSYPLEKLHQILQQQLAAIEVEQNTLSIDRISPKEGVPLLLSGINAISRELERLFALSMEEEIFQQQIEKILTQAVTWIPLFDSIEGKIEGDMSYFKGREAFGEFIHLLKGGDGKKALQALAASKEALTNSMNILFDSDTLLENIEKLIVSYNRAQIREPVQEGEVEALLEEQAMVIQILEKRMEEEKKKKPSFGEGRDEEALSELLDSSEMLQSALEYAKGGRLKRAKIVLAAAFQAIKRVKWLIEAREEVEVGSFLEQLISEQMSAMVINHLLQQLDGEKNIKEEGVEVAAQKEVLLLAEEFWQRAISQQKKYYHHPRGAAKDEAPSCLFHPWDEVVSLYDIGYEEAKNALALLEGEEANYLALIHQESAMRHFRKALEALKKPPQNSCHSPPPPPKSREQEEKSNTPPPQSEENKKKGRSIDDVVRLLQKMEQEDRKKKGKSANVQRVEEKSW